MKAYKRPCGQVTARTPDGRFREWGLADFNSSVCPNCGGICRGHYYGNSNDEFPAPRDYKQRCFSCEPLTDGEEKQIEESLRGAPCDLWSTLEDICEKERRERENE